MKTNAELQRDVLDERLSDPTVNAANIKVAAERGSVTLGGSIASYTEKWQAKRAAQRVPGVISVINNLEVELPPADERTDADLAGTANDSLRWNKLVPHELISVAATNGASIMRETLADSLTVREPVAAPSTPVSTARFDGHALRVGVSKASSSSGPPGSRR